MVIENSRLEDLDTIFELYQMATDYQLKKFPDNLWPTFERKMVEEEILNLQQWKLILNDEVACVWATTFNDPKIWEERDLDPSVYIHRIATNPKFRGQNFVEKIVEWAKSYALEYNKEYVRLDTCGENTRLIQYYTNNGFEFLGMWKLKNPEGLPEHYIGADVCFFEMDLKKKST